MTQQTLIWLEPECTTVEKRELERLRTIEELFWEIERALPAGYDDWLDYEERCKLKP